MTSQIIFCAGLFIGTMFGLFLGGLCNAASQDARDEERDEDWYRDSSEPVEPWRGA